MVHHVAIPLEIALPAGCISHGDALCTMPNQKCQPPSAPGVPLFVMAGERQHNDQFNITVLRLFLQPEYNFSRLLIYSKGPAHKKPADPFSVKRNKLLLHPLFQSFAAIVSRMVLPLEPCRSMAGDGTGMKLHRKSAS